MKVPNVFGRGAYSRTSYSKATPSGSFSANHVSAASTFCEHLDVLDVANLLAGIDVKQKQSLVSLQLALAPMGIFAVGIEDPFDVTI